jgi:hypothetical protein
MLFSAAVKEHLCWTSSLRRAEPPLPIMVPRSLTLASSHIPYDLLAWQRIHSHMGQTPLFKIRQKGTILYTLVSMNTKLF